MSDWLSHREPLDHAARSPELAANFVAALGETPYVLDLACGTGSNYRFLAPMLAGRSAKWLCVDNDGPTLARASERLGRLGVELRRVDLARDLHALRARGGVTCSAFLDLCSASFIDELVRWSAELPLLVALSFDGRVQWIPSDPLDERIADAWRESGRRDHGFGVALGADAASYLTHRLRDSGRRVELARSDWWLDAERPEHAAVLELLIRGIAARVGDVVGRAEVNRWIERRCAEREGGALKLRLGHVDVLGLPQR